jgi:hypothetical protein
MDYFEDIIVFIGTFLFFVLGVALFLWLYTHLSFGMALLVWMPMAVIGMLYLGIPVMIISVTCAGLIIFMVWLFTRLSRCSRP